MTTPPAGPGGGPFEPEYPIRTARLLLRPYRPDDVDAVYAYERLPETARYLENEPMSLAEAKALVIRRVGSSTLGGVGEVLNLVIELRAGYRAERVGQPYEKIPKPEFLEL